MLDIFIIIIYFAFVSNRNKELFIINLLEKISSLIYRKRRALPSHSYLTKMIFLLPIYQVIFGVIWIASILAKDMLLLINLYITAILFLIIVDVFAFWISSEDMKTYAAEQRLTQQKGLYETRKSEQSNIKEIANQTRLEKEKFNKFLNTLALQVESSAIEQAKSCLQFVVEEINDTRKKDVSKNNGANAVLCKIIDKCAANQVTLSLNVDIPAILNIKDIHVCSLVSNILNNAYNACVTLSHEQRRIIFSMTCVQGQFVINCQNKYAKGVPIIKGKGLGTEIIKDITDIYQGIYIVKDICFEYNVSVVIPLEKDGFVK